MSHAVMPGVNGMPRVVLSHPSGSSAEIYLNGAHVTSWKPAGGAERLFLSEAATFQEGKAIRGGIPVVFPQFADSGPLPKHGWLRTSTWSVDSSDAATSSIIDAAEQLGVRPLTSSVRLFTEDDHKSRALWPHGYRAGLTVTLDSDSLEVELAITNTGAEALEFTAALHSYLAVRDVGNASVSGLYGIPYIDKTASQSVVVDHSQEITISSETDRIYTNAPSRVALVDGAAERRLEIDATGFTDVVVWNPWGELARGIADMKPDDYLRFICVEAARAVTPFSLVPGETWRGSQKLTGC